MGAKPVLLLVEDDEDDLFLMVRAMKQAGIEVVLRTVSDGQQALEYLSGVGEYADREAWPLPSLLFLDIKMPRLSGFDVLRWIRSQESRRNLIVIMLTSSNHPDDLRRAYQLGVNSYVVKSASLQELIDFATAFKSYWLVCNCLPE